MVNYEADHNIMMDYHNKYFTWSWTCDILILYLFCYNKTLLYNKVIILQSVRTIVINC